MGRDAQDLGKPLGLAQNQGTPLGRIPHACRAHARHTHSVCMRVQEEASLQNIS